MKLTEQQIYEKVANRELTEDEALELIAGFNEQPQAPQQQAPAYMKTFVYDEDILKDHQIFGQQILMGVAHCSLAIEAAKAKYPDRVLHQMRKISFTDAIRVAASEHVQVAVTIEDKNGRILFTNTYQESGQTQVRQTASGEFAFEPSTDIARAKIDIQSLCKGASEHVSADIFYSNQSSYGPSQFTLRQVFYVQNGVIGEIQLRPQMRSQLKQYTIPPALFDGVYVNSLFCASLDHFGNDACVPLFIKAIHINRFH